MNKKRFSNKKLMIIVSILMVITATVGGVLAFLIDFTSDVKNTFIASEVTTEVNETIIDDAKTAVSIKNTGDIAAFIRAEVIISWKNDAGEVYGEAPVENTDYEITYNKTGWFEKDGFYYWSSPVAAGDDTGVLIDTITSKNTAPEGFYLNVEIIGSGVQVEGVKAELPENENQPAEIAWGVVVNNADGKAVSISAQ